MVYSLFPFSKTFLLTRVSEIKMACRPLNHWPTLFLVTINGLPRLPVLKCQALIFTDGIVLWGLGRDRQHLIGAIQQAMTIVSCFAKICHHSHLEVNCPKSIYSWYTLGRDIFLTNQ